jgi:hypothetical protein
MSADVMDIRTFLVPGSGEGEIEVDEHGKLTMQWAPS